VKISVPFDLLRNSNVFNAKAKIRNPKSTGSFATFLRVGGAGLFGMTMSDFFPALALEALPAPSGPKAKQMILLWMAGGPPHQDMFRHEAGYAAPIRQRA